MSVRHPAPEVTSRLTEVMEALTDSEREALTADEEAVGALTRVCAASPVLGRFLAVRPEWTRDLFVESGYLRPTSRQDLDRELARPGPQADEAEVLACLRDAAHREMIRIAARDLSALATLTETVGALSDVAEAALAAAVAHGFARLTAFHGRPPGLVEGRTGFVVLGLGKLGGRELNFSSDVDLVYLYHSDDDQAGVQTDGPQPVSLPRFYDALGRLVTRALGELTDRGLVFRVDLDLRPGGKDGALVQSLAAAESHYLYHGRGWERMALLKARPVAGDLELGERFVTDLIPFIFRRSLDFTALEEIRSLKRRFEARRRGPSEGEFNIKLDEGGIRQIEFLVQTLQIVFGGRMPELRRRDTLGGLSALADSGLIDLETADRLRMAYEFLRHLEHRLQMVRLGQTQALPRRDEELAALARAMGYEEPQPAADLRSELDWHLRVVAGQFQDLLTGPGEPVPGTGGRPEDLSGLGPDRLRQALARLGYTQPETARDLLSRLFADRVLMTQDQQRQGVVRRVVNALATSLAEMPDPDRGLATAARYLEAVGRRTSLYVLLFENPDVLKLLARVFGTSAHLSGLLIKNPGLLDALIDPRAGMVKRQKRDLQRELRQLLDRTDDPEESMGLLRRFINDERLRIGVRDLMGDLALPMVAGQTTHLAEVALETALAMARDMVARTGRRVPAMTVLGLGKLGGAEMGHLSDLDVLFICRENDPNIVETAVRVSQRLITILSLPVPEGPGYELDARLRPSGTFGPLVVSLDSFGHYHRTSQPWERQALIKLRVVAGNRDLGARVVAAAHQVVYGPGADLEPEFMAQRMHELRGRMVAERGRVAAGKYNLKLGWGGLVDVEFLVQYLQLLHGGREKGLRTPHTRRAIQALTSRGFLSPTDGRRLGDDFHFLRVLDQRLKLITGRGGDAAVYEAREIRQAARLGGELEGSDELKLDRVLGRVHDLYRRVLGVSG
jgi:glutamate-ammonia-ligase adenylyltransferase